MLIEFIEGPLWTISVVIFLVGVSYRLYANHRLGVKADLAPARPHPAGGSGHTVLGRFLPRREFMRQAMFVMVVGYVFHIALFVLLFFPEPHVRFIEQRILGFGWPAVPYWAFVLSAALTLASLVLLWMRRLLDPVRKKISTADDHLTALLLIAAILSGFMAMQQTYDLPRVLHLLLVELLLIYFPFSRLMHAFTIFFSRAYTGASYARRGVKV